jgi:hypothetical protein
MSKHWIVKVNSGHGVQVAHIESDTPPAPDHRITEIVEGPFETADEAWYAWHWRMGNINA